MATDFPVKYYNHAMRGAPQITGEPGTLVAALRAVLISGFGAVTAQSVTVDNGTATAVVGSGNSFDEYSVIQITGADDAALNGEARVLTATASTITWATQAADGGKTGTVQMRYAPVGGWHEPFTGTLEKAVFQSTDPESTGHYLWLDDSTGRFTYVRGYEAMSGIDSGTGAFPTATNHPPFWMKSGVHNNQPVRWDCVADSRMLLISIAPEGYQGSAYIAAPIRGFGEPVVLSPSGDAWASLLSCAYSENGGYHYRGALCQNFSNSYNTDGGTWCCRSQSGLGGAIAVRFRPLVGSDAFSGGDDFLGPFPSTIDGQLKYSQKIITAAHNSNTARALLPGLLHIPQSNILTYINARDRIQGAGSMQGRTLLALPTGNSSAPYGMTLVDITGPWR